MRLQVAVPTVSVIVRLTFNVLPSNVSVPPSTVTEVETPASSNDEGQEY